MKSFLGLLKKEYRHIFRDSRTMLIIFLIPILQVLLFGYVLNNEIKDVKIAILDNSKDNTTKEIITKLDASEYFEVITYLESNSEIDEEFKSGEIQEVIIFENNFGENLVKDGVANVQLNLDASDPNTAQLISAYTTAVINDYLGDKYQNVQKLPIESKTIMWFNKNLRSAYMFVPGTMAFILMLITAMMSSISIAREKEEGTMELLLVSPIKPLHIIIGKVLPYVILSIVNVISVILLGYFVFHVPLLGSIWLLTLVSLEFILTALTIGIFISTISKTQAFAMFASMIILMLPTILLSGFIFPIENMPIALQYLSYIVPPKYFLIAIKAIMLKGAGISVIWKEMVIMMAMIVFFTAVSIKKFKVRLE